MRENLILVDFVPQDDWSFKSDLEKESNLTFKVVIEDTHNLQGKVSVLFRYLSYFIVPIYYLLKRNSIEYIVAWQQFYGLLLAFWMRVFHIKKKNKLIVMTFIYKKRKGLVGKLYFQFIKYIVDSLYIDKFVCFSKHECEMYSSMFNVPRSKFEYCGLTIEDEYSKYSSKIQKGDFYLSAGRSNRDYEYLCSEFKEIPNERVIILCDNFSIDNCPQNVEFKENVYGDEYKLLLAQSKGVIIPLKKGDISAGQLAMIQAMMFGKPVIITKTATILEYVQDDVNAIIIDNKKNSVHNAIKRLMNKDTYEIISKNARKSFEDNYTGKQLAKTVGLMIRSLQEK